MPGYFQTRLRRWFATLLRLTNDAIPPGGHSYAVDHTGHLFLSEQYCG